MTQMQLRDTSIVDIVRDTWPSFKDYWTVALGMPALLCYVPFLLVGIPAGIVAFVVMGASAAMKSSAVSMAMIPVVIVACVCFAAVYNVIRVGWARATLLIAQGQGASFSDMKAGMPWFINFLIVNCVIGIATAIGTLLFIVPGILIAARCSFAPLLVIDENLPPIEAIMRSNQLVTGYTWQMCFYYVAYGVANLIGGLIPFVSIVAPVAVMGYFDLALARIYYLRK
jgi:hypothetical protein